MNINTALVEDIINLEEVDEEMKSVTEALQDNFNKTLNIRTAPGEWLNPCFRACYSGKEHGVSPGRPRFGTTNWCL